MSDTATAVHPAPVAEIQAALAEIAADQRAIDQRIATLLAALPPSADYLEPLLDWEIPPTLEAELFTSLEYIRLEMLGKLIELLERESRITLEEVKAEWQKLQAANEKSNV